MRRRVLNPSPSGDGELCRAEVSNAGTAGRRGVGGAQEPRWRFCWGGAGVGDGQGRERGCRLSHLTGEAGGFREAVNALSRLKDWEVRAEGGRVARRPGGDGRMEGSVGRDIGGAERLGSDL